jgi:hypothetical protein
MIRPLEPHKNENPLAGGFPSATAKKHEMNVTPVIDDSKKFATLRARLAMRGFVSYQIFSECGARFLIAGGSISPARAFRTLDEIEKFLSEIGGSK